MILSLLDTEHLLLHGKPTTELESALYDRVRELYDEIKQQEIDYQQCLDELEEANNKIENYDKMIAKAIEQMETLTEILDN